jgi:hypothetical protein
MNQPDPATAVYSCDDHLDLSAVQPDVWESRLPRAQAERGPRVVTRDGRSVWMCEDRVIGRSGMSGKKSAVAKTLSAIGRAGIEDDGYRAGKPELRLQDLDRDGLWASVIYGPLALGLPIDDPALQDACYAAWNDWARKFNSRARSPVIPRPDSRGRGGRSPRRLGHQVRSSTSSDRHGDRVGPAVGW